MLKQFNSNARKLNRIIPKINPNNLVSTDLNNLIDDYINQSASLNNKYYDGRGTTINPIGNEVATTEFTTTIYTTSSIELSVGETYGGGKIFKVVSGSYALIVDVNNLGAAQAQYMQIATEATSTTGSINQSLILARSGSTPNDYNYLLPGNAAHQLGGQYYGLDMEDPAVMAYSSSVGGYTDWYIPSTTEIAWINQGIPGRIYEGFSTANRYWTSNYAGAPYTYYVSDGQGRLSRILGENSNGGSTQHPVVAIRKINRSYREVYSSTDVTTYGSDYSLLPNELSASISYNYTSSLDVRIPSKFVGRTRSNSNPIKLVNNKSKISEFHSELLDYSARKAERYVDGFDNVANTLTINNVVLDYGTEGASPNNFEILVYGLHIPGNFTIKEVGNNVVITLNDRYIDFDNTTINDIYVIGKFK